MTLINILLYSVGFIMLIVIILNLVKSKIHNRILAYFLLIVFHGIMYNIYNPKHLPSLYFDITGLFFSIIYYGPILYLYLVSLFKNEIKNKFLVVHLIFPFSIFLIKLLVENNVAGKIKGFVSITYLFISSLLLIYYFYKGFKLVKKTKQYNNIVYKFRFRLFYYTVNSYFIILFLFVVLFGSYTIVNKFENSLEFGKIIFDSLFLIFSLILCFYGLTEAVWIKSFFINNPVEKLKNNQQELEDYQIVLKSIAIEKDFLNPNITIEMFSRNLALTPQAVSSAIKTAGHKNFSSFLNNYRIEHFKEKINSSKNKTYTLSAIAFECGFNSKTTFFRVFKEHEGMTPNQYLKSL